MGQFKPEPKMKTTEPSVELKLKKGGKAKMARGGMMGMPMVAPVAAPARPRRPVMPVARPMMKRGGKVVESAAHERMEEHEMKSLKKELKKHEHEPAHVGHRGLKKGGPVPGGLLSEGGPHKHGVTGDIEGTGYKKGGKVHRVSGHPEGTEAHHKAMARHHKKMAEGGSAHHKKMHEHHKHMAKMCKGGKAYADGGSVAEYENTKVVEAKAHRKAGKTGGVEGVGYKRGGKAKHHYATGGLVSEYANTKVTEAGSHKKAGKTGSVMGLGYKKGGKVHSEHGHHEHHKVMKHHETGHKHMHEVEHKHAKGGHVAHHKVAHKKKGGVCW